MGSYCKMSLILYFYILVMVVTYVNTKAVTYVFVSLQNSTLLNRRLNLTSSEGDNLNAGLR